MLFDTIKWSNIWHNIKKANIIKFYLLIECHMAQYILKDFTTCRLRMNSAKSLKNKKNLLKTNLSTKVKIVYGKAFSVINFL